MRRTKIRGFYNGKGTSVNSHYFEDLSTSPVVSADGKRDETKRNPVSRSPLRFGKSSVACMDSRCRCRSSSSSSSISITEPSDQLLLQSRSSSPSSTQQEDSIREDKKIIWSRKSHSSTACVKGFIMYLENLENV
ncbi:hypothetical protein MRB53_000412 [Persea americana]|uniref:Uncharacterized protein n=1 Tax=Persea americana TaxID=3435 RepID=A0ACC2MP24_PERAE|nr:hypothetical protein MRB53_000412 [Persea americana]